MFLQGIVGLSFINILELSFHDVLLSFIPHLIPLSFLLLCFLFSNHMLHDEALVVMILF